jgi:predicted metalloprotease
MTPSAAKARVRGLVLSLSLVFLVSVPATLAGQDENLDKLPNSKRAPRGVNTLVGAPNPQSDVQSFANFVKSLIDPFWQRTFAGAGLNYISPGLVVFDQASVNSRCGTAPKEIGPFYCNEDNTVYIPTGFFSLLSKTGEALTPGDFAPAYVMAHEWGHHIQNVSQIFAYYTALRQGKDEKAANALSVKFELMADCLAGVWARSAAYQNLLDIDDIQEAQTSAQRIGDDALGFSPENWTHGSAKQRLEWFNFGYQTGDGSKCRTFDEPRYEFTQYQVDPYVISVAPGTRVQQTQNRIVEVDFRPLGIAATAQIQVQQMSPGDAASYLGSVMQAWSPQAPLRPVMAAEQMNANVQHLGGTAVAQAYEQMLDGQRPVHGYFLLHVSQRGIGIIIDLFADGPTSSSSDWPALSQIAGSLLGTLQYLR